MEERESGIEECGVCLLFNFFCESGGGGEILKRRIFDFE